jgi:hypothetical protein
MSAVIKQDIQGSATRLKEEKLYHNQGHQIFTNGDESFAFMFLM